MTLGPEIQSSPRSPSATSLSGLSTLTNFNVMPGNGMPQEPGLGTRPVGVKVPAGEVSVMPHPSEISRPVFSLNRCRTSTGSGAPPEQQYFSEDRSASLAPGCPSNARYMVGTPKNKVTRLAAISLIVGSSSK